MAVFYRDTRYKHLLWLVKVLRKGITILDGESKLPEEWDEILEEVDFVLLMEGHLIGEVGEDPNDE